MSMLRFLKVTGAILIGFAIISLVIAAGLTYVAVGDISLGWIVGLSLILVPSLFWVYRQFRKIDW